MYVYRLADAIEQAAVACFTGGYSLFRPLALGEVTDKTLKISCLAGFVFYCMGIELNLNWGSVFFLPLHYEISSICHWLKFLNQSIPIAFVVIDIVTQILLQKLRH